MVKLMKDLNTVDFRNFDKLKKESYLFIVFRKHYDLNYRTIDKALNIGVFDGTLYVFGYDADLRLRVDLDDIDTIFSFSLEEE